MQLTYSAVRSEKSQRLVAQSSSWNVGQRHACLLSVSRVPSHAWSGCCSSGSRSDGRDLPWRHTRDPYAILVSEVMLQQTQVERVVPRYLAWLERWPTVGVARRRLAGRRDPRVAGARVQPPRPSTCTAPRDTIAETGWPDDLTELPGVGPYTAAAVRCFAFGDDVLPVDVNVASRAAPDRRTRSRRAAAQALMDLGATVCLARIPRCAACPLAAACPSRGIREEPARKQGPFEGSFRQRRATTLRRVAESPRELAELDDEAVRSLERDGLVVVEEGLVALPDRTVHFRVEAHGGRIWAENRAGGGARVHSTLPAG